MLTDECVSQNHECVFQNFLTIPQLPLPTSFLEPFPPIYQKLRGTVLQLFEALNVLGNSDHHILKSDVAQILGLGDSVQLLQIARAFRFNQWGVRALRFVLRQIEELQTDGTDFIQAIDQFATSAEAADVLDLEVRSAMIDVVLESDISRNEAQAILAAVDTHIASAKTEGITRLVSDAKERINGLINKRNDLFSGVAEALRAGTLKRVQATPDKSIHVDLVELKTIAMIAMRFVCVVTTSSSCKDWKWIEQLKAEIAAQVKACRSTVPPPAA